MGLVDWDAVEKKAYKEAHKNILKHLEKDKDPPANLNEFMGIGDELEAIEDIAYQAVLNRLVKIRDIQKGETYEFAKGLWEGTWDEYKTCRQCVAIRRDYGCGSHGMLRFKVLECLGFDYVKETGR